MNKCKTCVFRDADGVCTSEKLSEDNYNESTWFDMLIYSYNEGGYFIVGEEFGCVHHKEKVI